ncbi:MAG: 2-C-methyl-D-erythritol 4-phosphate cytidylyltransferase [Alteromonadaceae bacterium]|nr:2-C-methyl-D-erythritol 4-phosphate cytidylyltransferase [Alteromonadaceae bacterium]
MTKSKVVAVVPAAGVGSRMQADRPKQYLTIGAHTILEHTLLKLAAHPDIARVIVALSPDDEYFPGLAISKATWLTTVKGGNSRADSVRNALNALAEDEWALVHDAARPCVNEDDLDQLIAMTLQPDFCGAILATPVRDTMKRAVANAKVPQTIAHTESRDNLWHALTPQLFPAKTLAQAIDQALVAGATVTDEASAMEFAGHQVLLIDSDPANIKITHPADLPLAQFYLQQGLVETSHTGNFLQ